MITLREFIEKNQYISEGIEAKKILSDPKLLAQVHYQSKMMETRKKGVRVDDGTSQQFELKSEPNTTEEQLVNFLKIAATSRLPFKEKGKVLSYEGGITATLL